MFDFGWLACPEGADIVAGSCALVRAEGEGEEKLGLGDGLPFGSCGFRTGNVGKGTLRETYGVEKEERHRKRRPETETTANRIREGNERDNIF